MLNDSWAFCAPGTESKLLRSITWLSETTARPYTETQRRRWWMVALHADRACDTSISLNQRTTTRAGGQLHPRDTVMLFLLHSLRLEQNTKSSAVHYRLTADSVMSYDDVWLPIRPSNLSATFIQCMTPLVGWHRNHLRP